MEKEYEETVEWLYGQLPMFSVVGAGAYKPGLQTSMLLDDAFGNRHRQYKTLHVAGTNGKGSTSHALASVLMAAGCKTGLYTSPHLADFRERIRVNGEKISKEAVVDFVKRYREMGLGCEPSFFELTTIMAFDYFAQQGVDYAVIETGLGGRLDTTNIITPIASIITNVTLDHTAQLGDTEQAIAGEKAGIIKPGVPVIIGRADGEVRKVFADKASQAGSPVVFAQESPVAFKEEDGRLMYELANGEFAPTDLAGDWQKENINTVVHALDAIGLVSPQCVKAGLADVAGRTGLMGRWTRLGHAPELICDTGHNIGAWQWLAPRLAAIAERRKATIVLGFVSDKDVDAIFPLLPRQARYIFVEPKVKRARTAESLLALARDNGLCGEAVSDVRAGLELALRESGPDDFVFIGGSNYVVAEIL